MLSTTWNGWASSANVPIAKQGTNSRGEKFYDISPQYQDQAVANQLRVNGVEGDLKSKGISGTLQSNSFVCQWASVPAPHSGCSQKNSQSGGFVQNYEKILAEEKSPGGCGQGSQDLPATAVLEKFDLSLNNPALIKQSNDYSEEDLKNKLDELEWRVKDEGIHNVLGSIFSGNVQVEAQSDIQAERERLAGLFRDGKLSSQDGDDISNSLNGGFKDNLVRLMLKVYDAGFSYRGGANNGPRRGYGGHGAGEAFDFFNFQKSSTYSDANAKWVDQVNFDPQAFAIVKEAVEVMKSTGVVGGNQLIGPDSMKAQGIVFLGNTDVPGHNDHIHVQVDSAKAFDGSGVSSSGSNSTGSGVNCTPCAPAARLLLLVVTCHKKFQ
ncbi:MAG: hypothetical protein HC932_02530 [Thermales bacterium]|nr:hypothetical protein [Thermales bacterium]